MSEKEKRSNLFKLDGNIDGTYIDENNEVKSIENMIQIVGASDGPKAYPTLNTRDASFSATDLAALETNQIDVEENVNTEGHGIVYDKNGKPIAHAGDLIFRDGQNNVATLSDLVEKVNTIFVDSDGQNYLRDNSLQEYNTNDLGVTLDEIIEKTIEDAGMFGTGNVIQLARNYDVNSSTVSVWTLELSENNTILIVASASIAGEAKMQLRDVTTNTILDSSYVKAEATKATPIFLSYVGKLSNSSTGVTESSCNKYVWSTFLKRFFTLKPNNSLFQAHQIALEVVSGAPYYRGTINIVCYDDGISKDTIKSGNEIVNNANSVQITFPVEMPSVNYSISLQLENNIAAWYSDKTVSGFTVKFENNYTGNLIWSAIYVKS